MNWINHPLVLEGDRIRLVPLEREHLAGLLEAGRDSSIWDQLPLDGTRKDNMIHMIGEALLKRVNGEQYPFTVLDKSTRRIIGSTRLFELFPHHKKLEIGWTWYHPDYWGKGINTESKLLLLTYCFEQLKVNRVQFKTRNTNFRSAGALKKIGARFEGILRKDRIMSGGEVRDTVMFSILDEEWEEVKNNLMRMLLPGHLRI